uniref:Uncharacterized protein n=1 Tax=Tanacetum cinerariifolium TaxID=118510 RepID=A0A6L2NWP8_TANCI|nr:hypothetical protein [Tanacetum cinerariifolium]
MQILIKEILRQTGTIVEYSDMFKSLFGIVSLLSDMGEDETHYVDLFIEGLRSKTGIDDVRCDEVELKVSEMDDNNKETECANLIALDELYGGKVKGIEMESDDLVESNEVSKCLVVADNFARKDNEIEKRNKRMG